MRPDSRPDKPYTRAEILDRVWQHFVVEGNPKSVMHGTCVYGDCGCAVGCLMTKRDAESLDAGSLGDSIEFIHTYKPDIYNAYFSSDYLVMLGKLQGSHDKSEPDELKDVMESEITRLRKELV